MAAQLATKLHEHVRNHVRNPERSPDKLDWTLEESCRQEARNIWLDAGFQAWYAWFCSDNDTKATLARLPDLELREIAQSVCSIKPDATVQTLFEHLFYKSFRGVARRRKL